MGWEIAITLGAIALLALLHLAYATEGAEVGADRLGERARGLTGDRDPWTLALVGAAAVAALFAIGVVAGPAVFGSEESTPATRPTVTAPTTSTTAPTTSRSTTTTRPPTTTTTTPVGPPSGTVLIAETAVSATGHVQQSYSRLGEPPVVRAVGTGVYRVLLPRLRPGARTRVTLRVHAAAGTKASVRKRPTSPAFVVSTRDAATGKPASRNFVLEIYGPPADGHPAPEPNRHLPKTT